MKIEITIFTNELVLVEPFSQEYLTIFPECSDVTFIKGSAENFVPGTIVNYSYTKPGTKRSTKICMELLEWVRGQKLVTKYTTKHYNSISSEIIKPNGSKYIIQEIYDISLRWWYWPLLPLMGLVIARQFLTQTKNIVQRVYSYKQKPYDHKTTRYKLRYSALGILPAIPLWAAFPLWLTLYFIFFLIVLSIKAPIVP